MTSLSFQFHAEPSEILTMSVAWAESMGLHLALEVFRPTYTATSVEASDLVLSEIGDVSRVSLSLRPFDLDVNSSLEFVRSNSDALTILIGTSSTDSLRESLMAAAADDPATIAAWQKIRRLAQKSMHKGALVVNPMSGARAEVGAHRYTDGALRLARSGVKMLAIGGWNEFELDEIRSDRTAG